MTLLVSFRSRMALWYRIITKRNNYPSGSSNVQPQQICFSLETFLFFMRLPNPKKYHYLQSMAFIGPSEEISSILWDVCRIRCVINPTLFGPALPNSKSGYQGKWI